MRYFIFILLIAFPLTGTTYYVDQNGVHGTVGNDNYSGESWDEPWATITKAANTLQAGDSVIVAQATYRERIRPMSSGTPANPIVYLSDEQAVIAGSEPVDEDNFTKVAGYDYLYAIHFPDFEIRGVVQLAGNDSIVLRPYFDVAESIGEVDDTAGSFLQQNDTVYIHTVDDQRPDSAQHDLEFIKEQFGVDIRDRSNIIFKGFVIRSQSSLGNAGFGVYFVNCRNLQFLQDTVVGGVIRGVYSSNVTIDHCSINRIWRISTPYSYHMLPHGMSGISFLGTDTLLISNCEVWWMTDAGGLQGDCDSVVYTDTKWWGCPNHGIVIKGDDGGGPRPSNITFRGCESGSECQEAIYIYYSDNITIENCDLSSVRQFALETTGHSRNIKLVNTMITRKLWIAESSIDEYDTDYNCVYYPQEPDQFIEVGYTYYTLQEWQQLSGNDYHSLNEDPLVENWDKGPGHPDSDFYLTEYSPCIDAGDPSYEPPPGGGDTIDIGAYEYISPRVSEKPGYQFSQIVSAINPKRFPVISGAEGVIVYDVSGRTIKKLGFHNNTDISWNSKHDLSAGVYFYKYQKVRCCGKFLIIR